GGGPGPVPAQHLAARPARLVGAAQRLHGLGAVADHLGRVGDGVEAVPHRHRLLEGAGVAGVRREPAIEHRLFRILKRSLGQPHAPEGGALVPFIGADMVRLGHSLSFLTRFIRWTMARATCFSTALREMPKLSAIRRISMFSTRYSTKMVRVRSGNSASPAARVSSASRATAIFSGSCQSMP